MNATARAGERGLDELERRLRRRQRVLVVANETCDDPSVCDAVLMYGGRRADVRVVAPALPSLAKRWTVDDESAVRDATERTKRTVACLNRLGLHADGQVGDADPLLAIEDALYDFPADEIIVFTWPEGRSRWRPAGIAQRARARFNKRVTQVAVEDRSTPAHSRRA